MSRYTSTDTPRRIAFVIPSLAPYGSQMVLRDLVIQAQKWDECLVICIDPLSSPAIALPDGLEVVSLGRQRTGFAGLAGATVKLAWLLRQNKIDAVLSFLPYANNCAVLANLIAVKPATVVVTEHSTPNVERKTQSLIESLSRRLYPHAQSAVAVSRSVATSVSRAYHLPPQWMQVINNPVDLAGIRSRAVTSHSAPAHPWLAETSERPVLISVGRLMPPKGQDITLRALAEPSLSGVRALFLGDGPSKDELIALAASLEVSDRVDFLGYQSNPHPFVAGASALVHATRREGFGLVLVEAAALGVPVVATDVDAVPELIPALVPGRMVPVDDHCALAEAVRAVLQDPPAVADEASLACLSLPSVWARYRELLVR